MSAGRAVFPYGDIAISEGPTVTIEDGKRVIHWPDGQREPFLITSELFEQLINELNEQA